MPPLEAQPLADNPALNQLGEKLYHNVSDEERMVSVLFGLALAAVGGVPHNLRDLLFTAAGVALVHRGVTGHCGLYERLGVNSQQQQES